MKVRQLHHVRIGEQAIVSVHILERKDFVRIVLEIDGFVLTARGVCTAVTDNSLFISVAENLDHRFVFCLVNDDSWNPAVVGILDEDEGIFLLAHYCLFVVVLCLLEFEAGICGQGEERLVLGCIEYG